MLSRSVPSTLAWLPLTLLLSTFAHALPMPAGQQPFGILDSHPTSPSNSTSTASSVMGDFTRLARLSSEHRCSSDPLLAHTTSSSSPDSSRTTTTYLQPYPLESIAEGVALLSASSRETELVPLRSSNFFPDVPWDVLVMRIVRDRFESEVEHVQSLIDRSLTEGAVSSTASDHAAVVEVVGRGLAAPVALLHALHLHLSYSTLTPLARPLIATTLFSTPRFANDPFSSYLSSLASNFFTIRTISSPLDALPQLPPRGSKKFGFRDLHAGSKYEMSEDGGEIKEWDSGLVGLLGREQKRWTAKTVAGSEKQGWEAMFERECPAVTVA